MNAMNRPADATPGTRHRAVKWLKRAAATAAALAALVWAGASAYIYFKQGSIVYLPTRDWIKSPKDAGLPFEDLRLTVTRANGAQERINAWWLPAAGPAAGAAGAAGTTGVYGAASASGASGASGANSGISVLFLHGNARNMGAATNTDKVVGLARAGFNVLTLDYRGYGKSEGDAPYEAAVYEDAGAALDELKRRAPDAAKRILHGHSMGGAVAIELAARHPREFIAAFIEASFTSMLDMSTLNPVYRALPLDTLLTERFESAQKIGGFKLPVLFIHGTADQRIPHRMSQQLYAHAPQPKTLISVNGATHNNLHTFPEYASAYRLLLEMAKK